MASKVKKTAWKISDILAGAIFAVVGIALLFASTLFNDEIVYGCIGSGIMMILFSIITFFSEYKNSKKKNNH